MCADGSNGIADFTSGDVWRMWTTNRLLDGVVSVGIRERSNVIVHPEHFHVARNSAKHFSNGHILPFFSCGLSTDIKENESRAVKTDTSLLV